MRKLKLSELNRLTPDQFKSASKIPVIAVLDNLRSGLNVGSIFRSADSFALEHIYLCGITPRPPHKEIFKTAIGATSSVNWSYAEDVNGIVSELKGQGWKIILIEQTDSSVSLGKISESEISSKGIVFVFGNEVEGVSESLLKTADLAVELDQFGTKHSLNVSVCAGIVFWHFCRL